MRLYPAIDLLDGAVVRLRQGDYGAVTTYGDDPVSVAESFAAAGAEWVHLVDLDAARTGAPTNRATIARVARHLSGAARVQCGGGVRSAADADELARAGVARVVMGSAAVRDPGLVSVVADIVAVAVGLDHRGGVAAVDGWTESSGRRIEDLVGEFPRAAAFVVTDIARDGMLTGPDVEGLRALVGVAPSPVVASGGVGGEDDLIALTSVGGLEGVIVGRAIYEGRVDVARAVEVLR